MLSRLGSLIQPSIRARFAVLMVFVCAGGPIELAGIAVVAAMMKLVATGGKLSPAESKWLHFVYLSDLSPHQVLWVGLLVSIVILVFVHGFVGLRSYLRCQFSWRQDKELSCRLFGLILARPYAWFLARNSSEIQHLVLTGEIVQRVIAAILSVLSQLSVSLTLLLALLWTDTKVTIIGIVVVGSAYGLVRLLTHELLSVKGGGAHFAERQRRRVAQEALGSIRFVKTSSKESFFLERFEDYSKTAASGMVYHAIYVDVVRAFLEWVTFAGILTLSVILVINTNDIQVLLPRLALYTMATYRIVPAVHELFGLWARLRFDQPHLEDVFRILDGIGSADSVHLESIEGFNSGGQLVQLEGVEFFYAESANKILQDVNLDIVQGEWIGVVGTSGAGKTTLLDILSGLLAPTGGLVKVNCEPIEGSLVHGWHSSIGVVPQDIYLLDDSLRNNVAFGVPEDEIDDHKVLDACEAAGLSQLIRRLPKGLDTSLGERGLRLSGGERQRVGIARALYPKPKLLLLDEATSALDLATEAQIVETLRGLTKRCTLITVAHRLSSVMPCDRLLLLSQGRIVAQGPYQELARENSFFQELARLNVS